MKRPRSDKDLLEVLVMAGLWDELERYLKSIFDKEDTTFAQLVQFEVKRQMYREALNSTRPLEAIDILNKMKALAATNEEVSRNITGLLSQGTKTERFEMEDPKNGRASLLHALHDHFENRGRLLDPSKLNLTMDGKIEEGQIEIKKDKRKLEEEVEWPKKQVTSLNCTSDATSLEFNPKQHAILLAGSVDGHVMIWNLCSEQEIPVMPGRVNKEQAAGSVIRVTWAPCGYFFGTIFGNGMMEIHVFDNGDMRSFLHWERHPHMRGVNDLRIFKPVDILVAITCGNDFNVKVWDVLAKELQRVISGHNVPVHSLGLVKRHDTLKIASVDDEGTFILWEFANEKKEDPVIMLHTEYQGATRLAMSGDMQRVILSGNTRNGLTVITKMGKYQNSRSALQYIGVVDNNAILPPPVSCCGQYLTASDAQRIKIWNQDLRKIKATIAVADVPARPFFAFNTELNLLAVSSNGGKINVLASSKGERLLSGQFLCHSERKK